MQDLHAEPHNHQLPHVAVMFDQMLPQVMIGQLQNSL